MNIVIIPSWDPWRPFKTCLCSLPSCRFARDGHDESQEPQSKSCQPTGHNHCTGVEKFMAGSGKNLFGSHLLNVFQLMGSLTTFPDFWGWKGWCGYDQVINLKTRSLLRSKLWKSDQESGFWPVLLHEFLRTWDGGGSSIIIYPCSLLWICWFPEKPNITQQAGWSRLLLA